MAVDSIRLTAAWPHRDVEVEVVFKRPLGGLMKVLGGLERRAPDLVALPPEALESKAALVDFLREATRASGEGESVRVVGWANHRSKLYKALGIGPGDPQPIRVPLGDG
jgi:hypothetical protein